MLYYRSHIEKTPLTGRERFIAVTREQFMKIANAEAIGVRLFSFFFKATIYSFQFPQSVCFFQYNNTVVHCIIESCFVLLTDVLYFPQCTVYFVVKTQNLNESKKK